ncbi:MAG: lipoprotein signal peptidase [Bacteroidaceae bacterium]|nr:lipoprotein signal peptidase [Bacteroidaceae bacterium]
MRNQFLASVVLILGIIGVDQCVKIWVKTHMALHDVIDITGWFKIAFVENNGMAFGMELVDKIFLTSFRIVAVVWIVWYMARVIRRGTGWAYVVCLSMILAGAAGNIIDCMFYGMIFNNPSSPLVAEFVSWGSGYESLFYGRVVDMLYFPLVEWRWPDWMPVCGGNSFIFFSPIFNIADASITCGVMALILFCRKYYMKSE